MSTSTSVSSSTSTTSTASTTTTSITSLSTTASTGTSPTTALSTTTSTVSPPLSAGTTNPKTNSVVIVKKGKIGDVIVHFRPKASYLGEFGFDWMRVGDWSLVGTLNPSNTGSENYQNLIDGGYDYDADKIKAYAGLEEEYENIPIDSAPTTSSGSSAPATSPLKYYVPWLTVYPQTATTEVGASVRPAKAEVELELLAEILVEPDKIMFEFDSALFDVTPLEITNKSVSINKKSVGSVKITCKTDLEDKHTPITVYAIKGSDKTLAGKINVCRNEASKRESKKIALIQVLTSITPSAPPATFQTRDVDVLINSLHQAYIHAEIDTTAPTLDLRLDPNFITTVEPTTGASLATFVNGRRILERGFSASQLNDLLKHGRVPTTELRGDKLLDYMEKLYNKQTSNAYKDHLKVFSMPDQFTDVRVLGMGDPIGGNRVVLWACNLVGVLAHESGHAIGLYHTHRDPVIDSVTGLEVPGPFDRKQKYTFQIGKTDNIMSYNSRTLRVFWHWQWRMLNGVK